jgi:hypothetical protein
MTPEQRIAELEKGYEELSRIHDRVVAADDKRIAELEAKIERQKSSLIRCLDLVRLLRENKPVPLDFVERDLREAIGEV